MKLRRVVVLSAMTHQEPFNRFRTKNQSNHNYTRSDAEQVREPTPNSAICDDLGLFFGLWMSLIVGFLELLQARMRINLSSCQTTVT